MFNESTGTCCDASFARMFLVLDDNEAEVAIALLTAHAQSANRHKGAQEWLESTLPRSVLKEEYRGFSVGELFTHYLRNRQDRSIAHELVTQRALRVQH